MFDDMVPFCRLRHSHQPQMRRRRVVPRPRDQPPLRFPETVTNRRPEAPVLATHGEVNPVQVNASLVPSDDQSVEEVNEETNFATVPYSIYAQQAEELARTTAILHEATEVLLSLHERHREVVQLLHLEQDRSDESTQRARRAEAILRQLTEGSPTNSHLPEASPPPSRFYPKRRREEDH